ncbi:MAG TPA: glycosyltransferase, partial [Candidatus Eremiobacteraceae bacterium]|nr:glycosyltransferase [Candidatus Eremiobacteraceae bacterium]
VLAGASGSYALPAVPPSVRVRSVGRVGDAELASLYARASLLAHPSLYEGFGLPVLEAMAAGTPVVASDIPSVREAAGDAAEFVKPGDAAAFSQALQRVLTDSSLAAGLRARGTARAATKSWDLTAEQTLHSIRRAVEESGE